jgi:hypothetical protein
MGTVFMGFSPQGMTFEQYFRMEGRPELEQQLRFRFCQRSCQQV